MRCVRKVASKATGFHIPALWSASISHSATMNNAGGRPSNDVRSIGQQSGSSPSSLLCKKWAVNLCSTKQYLLIDRKKNKKNGSDVLAPQLYTEWEIIGLDLIGIPFSPLKGGLSALKQSSTLYYLCWDDTGYFSSEQVSVLKPQFLRFYDARVLVPASRYQGLVQGFFKGVICIFLVLVLVRFQIRWNLKR